MRRGKRKGAPGKRDVIIQAPHRITGANIIPGLSEQPIAWESTLERDAAKLLAFCFDVEQLGSQNSLEYYGQDGVARRYSADLQVLIGGAWVYIEIKPLSVLLQAEKRLYYSHIHSGLAEQGKPLDFLTDDQVNRYPYINNADLLSRYWSHALQESVLRLLESELEAGAIPIRTLVLRNATELALEDVYAAISQRCLWIDWETELTVNSLVALPNQTLGGLRYEDVLAGGRYGLVLERLVLGDGEAAGRVLAAEKTRRQRVSGYPAIDFV